MEPYDLAALAKANPKNRHRSDVALPALEESLGARRLYLAGLRRLLNGLAAETRVNVLERYRLENKAVGDKVNETWFTNLVATSLGLQMDAEQMVRRILRLEARRHTNDFMKVAKRTLGIDLSVLVHEEDLADTLRTMVGRNMSLIKSLSDETVKRVEQSVYEAALNGDSYTTLRRKLNQQFGVADNRAKLIARDQMAKANADLNRVRHEQAGITQYRWLTSQDERVRERHRQLHGRVYTYGKPTGAEDGLPPGKPINCRCVAQAIVKF